MQEGNDQLNKLRVKLEQLIHQQNNLSRELINLQDEISQLTAAPAAVSPAEPVTTAPEPVTPLVEAPPPPVSKPGPPKAEPVKSPAQTVNLERFIGENLISKIGIAITIIGVGIGTKYAIDHQLLSPLTRIILGYLIAIGLLAFAIRLKPKYEAFSAVLLSGALAIMYFLTFAAFSFYDLIPKLPTFGLMVLFTVFTVVAALSYNRVVIAHIGLVGAYAVPFLLSDGTGEVLYLFTYVAVINSGILALSLRKYWKSLYYAAFGLTWLIYFAWWIDAYNQEYFQVALSFALVFFVIFYLTFLAYKVLKKETFQTADIFLLLSNSFIYYSLGYFTLSDHEEGQYFLGLFTLLNAILHFIVGVVLFQRKLADRNLFYLIIGLVMVFLTIAIPVQLDGNWVTLLWIGEAALLFWIGRSRKVPTYEKLAYPLILLAFGSLLQDWNQINTYMEPDVINPLLNIGFLTGLLFFGGLFVIYRTSVSNKHLVPALPDWLEMLVKYVIPGMLLVVAYNIFRLEIALFWDNRIVEHLWILPDEFALEKDLLNQRLIWLINYSLLFIAALSSLNTRWIKSSQLAYVIYALALLGLIIFLTEGLYAFSELRASFINGAGMILYLVIRYISFGFVALLFVTVRKQSKADMANEHYPVIFGSILQVSILWIVSSELIHWLDLAGYNDLYKLGLSILWGCFSLIWIAAGINLKKKYLRIGAIALFAVTLLKLFLYDISHLDTLAKTIVFVSLGILMLIVSYLYNRYKTLIFDTADE